VIYRSPDSPVRTYGCEHILGNPVIGAMARPESARIVTVFHDQ
jgi:hypothetical protein